MFARPTNSGNAKASSSGTSNRYSSPRFLFIDTQSFKGNWMAIKKLRPTQIPGTDNEKNFNSITNSSCRRFRFDIRSEAERGEAYIRGGKRKRSHAQRCGIRVSYYMRFADVGN